MTWRALVPVKDSRSAKSRLAGTLTWPQRRRLSQIMLDHVLDALRQVEDIELIGVVSRHVPSDGAVSWLRDKGKGLNAELTRARQAWGGNDILVIHADLPLVTADEIRALLNAAEESGRAIAPDRHGSGTNAVAVKAGQAFHFRFGRDSLERHSIDLHPASIVRPGLAVDVDNAEDLGQVFEAGTLELKARYC